VALPPAGVGHYIGRYIGHYGGAVGAVLEGGFIVYAAPAHVEVDGVAVVVVLGTAGEAVPALAAVAAGVEVEGGGVVSAGVEGADGGVPAVKDGAGFFGEGAEVYGEW